MAPGKKIIAMVKANAYGCGLATVLPILDGNVDAFGVASLEEALQLRALGSRADCILFQGVFSSEELAIVVEKQLQCVLHQKHQFEWLMSTPLTKPLRVWVKVDTGMHRLGFSPAEVPEVIEQLSACPWVAKPLGLMTHLASADEPELPQNQQQIDLFSALSISWDNVICSIANSAAIMALPNTHADVVRPGIMLYGISPFSETSGRALGLRPVMRFFSEVSALHDYPKDTAVGYGGSWQSKHPVRIAVVPVGYGDGYPRHIAENTPVWIHNRTAPIVGRVSMDMLMIDVTACPEVTIGSPVELWGEHIAVETVAKAAGTIAYELICQISQRAR